MSNVTAEQLAERLARVRRSATLAVEADRPADEPVGLAPQQARLWFLHQLTADPASCNLHRAIRLRGALDVGALRAAIAAVAARQGVLRARFRVTDGLPLQSFDGDPHQTRFVDLAGAAGAPSASELIAAETARPFDLGSGPPFRSVLYRTALDEYLLVLTLHHIVADRWSLQLLLREIGTAYERALQRAAPLASPPLQYADFVRAQERRLAGPSAQRALAYWSTALGGSLPVAEFPADRTAAPDAFVAATRRVRVDAPTTTALRALAREHNATLFMAALTVFAVLLRRYSGQSELIVGVPIAGRGSTATEELIGLFVNALPLRVAIDDERPFVELLQRVRGDWLDAYEHQDIPWDALIEALRPARARVGSPFFQTLFALQNTPPERLSLEGVSGEIVSASTAASALDFSFVAHEDGAALDCAVEFNAARYAPETIERILRHFATLCANVLADPQVPLHQLELLDDDERGTIVERWNARRAPVDERMRLHELFAAQVRARPAHPAVVDGARTWTYAELDERANRLAALLGARGVGPGDRVAFCLGRSPELIAAVIAIMKAGAVCVPLDPANPSGRLRSIIEKTTPPLILAETRQRALLRGLDVSIVNIDEPAAFALPAEAAPSAPGDGRSLAYILFTSGSTGAPQGVMLEHRGFVNYVSGADVYGIRPDDRVLQFMALGFDVSVGEIWGTLCAGATLCLRDDEMLATPARFFARCSELGITYLILPTVYFHELAGAFAGSALPLPPRLRSVAFAGEAVRADLVQNWLAGAGTAVRLLNHYGPTEATIAVTCYDAHAPVAADEDRVAIGKPIANLRCYVLDAQRRPVPIGVTGELYLAGLGLARGYLGNPERTAERFVPDPFASDPTERMYGTGDLARYRADGNLEFLGRTDHQVKIRGFRVELGEIEAHLEQHPAVRQSVVVPHDTGRDKLLVAYVALSAGLAEPARELRHFLAQRLPSYMCPARVVVLERLPLTSSGKIDRRALPAPDASGTAAERPSPAPGDVATHVVNLLDVQLADLFAEVLGIGAVSIDDDFFELGGASLQAARLIARIESVCGERVAIKTLFEASTPRRLADRIIADVPPPAGPLVKLQTGTRPSPLFFLYGDLYGSGIYVRELARALQPERGICALPPHPTAGPSAFATVEAMAADYAALIEHAHPDGPYLIGGYCNGGTVAYEIARQLRARGKRVAPLVLIGSPAYNTAFTRVRAALRVAGRVLRWSSASEGRWYLRVRERLMSFRQLGDAPPAAYLALTRAMLRRVIARGKALGSGGSAAAAESTPYERMVNVLAQYFPDRYDEPVHLVWGREDEPVLHGDPTMGWGAVASQLVVHHVPGDHHTMVTREVRTLAEILRAAHADWE